MRRPAILLLALLAPTLAACQTGFDEGKETVRPLKVAHASGETKVPGQATRPLTFSAGGLDAALALGVEPVGAARVPRYLRRASAGVTVLQPPLRGALTRLDSLAPDVILGSKVEDGRLYDGLSRVAPTVMSDGEPEQNWKLDLRLFGTALGRTNAAEALLSRWDGQVTAARRRLGKRTVAVVRGTRAGLRMAGADSFAGRMLIDAGVAGRLEPGPFTRYDARRANADVLLLSSTPGAPVPLSCRCIVVEDALWWGGDGYLAAQAALADLERALSR